GEGGGRGWSGGGRRTMPRKRRQRARRVRRRVQLVRLMTIVDQNHEPPRQPARGVPQPLDRCEVDFNAPADFEFDPEPGEVLDQFGCGRWTLEGGQVLRHVYLSQTFLALDDLVYRHGIEQLIRDEHSSKWGSQDIR